MDGRGKRNVPALFEVAFLFFVGNRHAAGSVHWLYGGSTTQAGRTASSYRESPLDDLKWAIARQIPHLRRFAFALTRDPNEADDVVQDCLERALRKRSLWSRKGSLRSWLFSMLYRTHIDHRRRQSRFGATVGPEAIDSVASQPPDQDHRVECRDIGESLDRLPEEQRVVILLVALEGLSYDEAAEILNVPIGTVRSRLSRGRHTLRDLRSSTLRPRNLRRVK
jgi:RNA polymerase sigma-70 factor, ECF subfamily